MNYPTIDQLSLKSQRVFIRVGLNVPLSKDGQISDDTRIRLVVPTIQYAREQGAKIILASHLGRPKGKVDTSLSLKPIANCLSGLLKSDVAFVSDCVGPEVEERVRKLAPGKVLLLENLRFHREEEENDAKFSQSLASLADVYINEAFSASHRTHASIVGITNYIADKSMGLVMKREIDALLPLRENPEKPFAVILGGAKVKSKIGLIKELMSRVDMILFGGAMALTVQKAFGIHVGKSPVESELLKEVKAVCEKGLQQGVTLLLPKDHMVAPDKSHTSSTSTTSGRDIPDDRQGLDIGAQTINMFRREISIVRTVFWNGPLGVSEIPPFDRGTKMVAEAIVEHVPYSVIGGGDTVAALTSAGLAEKFTHCSTGGGASLAFLKEGDLPGLKALWEQETC